MGVKLHSAIANIFTVLAIAGLVLAPVARSAMAMASPAMAVVDEAMAADAGSVAMPDNMPCCPGEKPLPDCSKDCPLVLLCVAVPLQIAMPTGLFIRRTLVSVIFPGEATDLTGLSHAPPRRPPKI
jgi:hypothetical protein